MTASFKKLTWLSFGLHSGTSETSGRGHGCFGNLIFTVCTYNGFEAFVGLSLQVQRFMILEHVTLGNSHYDVLPFLLIYPIRSQVKWEVASFPQTSIEPDIFLWNHRIYRLLCWLHFPERKATSVFVHSLSTISCSSQRAKSSTSVSLAIWHIYKNVVWYVL